VRSDLLVGFFGDADLDARFRDDPTVRQVPAMKAGAYAPIVGEDKVAANSSPSVLSIPWVLDDYAPILVEAANPGAA
jgi:iron complex transport system substrate-binding protein